VCAIIGVWAGVVFWLVDMVISLPMQFLENLIPGLAGLLYGLYYFAAPLAAVIIRKPGAALFAELVAAGVELTLGNQWGVGGSLLAGLFQGALAELVFLCVRYRRWNVWLAALSGALAAFGGHLYTFAFQNSGMSFFSGYMLMSLLTGVVSGAVLGAAMWWLYRRIRSTGALDRFASGRAPAALA
jgi:energy-coupling factor transport system substrate-specific component